MKEDTYLQGREHFIDLTNDPNVDGVYETQVSSCPQPIYMFHVIENPTRFLSLPKPTKTCLHEVSGLTMNRSGFDQLDRPPSYSSHYRYLNDSRNGKYIFLYHASSANSAVHMFAILLPKGAVRLDIIDPAISRQPIIRLSETYHESSIREFDSQKRISPSTILLHMTSRLHFTPTTPLR